jgi:hypothetical protein
VETVKSPASLSLFAHQAGWQAPLKKAKFRQKPNAGGCKNLESLSCLRHKMSLASQLRRGLFLARFVLRRWLGFPEELSRLSSHPMTTFDLPSTSPHSKLPTRAPTINVDLPLIDSTMSLSTGS